MSLDEDKWDLWGRFTQKSTDYCEVLWLEALLFISYIFYAFCLCISGQSYMVTLTIIQSIQQLTNGYKKCVEQWGIQQITISRQKRKAINSWAETDTLWARRLSLLPKGVFSTVSVAVAVAVPKSLVGCSLPHIGPNRKSNLLQAILSAFASTMAFSPTLKLRGAVPLRILTCSSVQMTSAVSEAPGTPTPARLPIAETVDTQFWSTRPCICSIECQEVTMIHKHSRHEQ